MVERADQARAANLSGRLRRAGAEFDGHHDLRAGDPDADRGARHHQARGRAAGDISYLLGAALGGWIGGILADRFGRVRVLQLTILLVALSTFAAAFANGFAYLAVARAIQGVGYGAEAAVGAVLVMEVVNARLRGRVDRRSRAATRSATRSRWRCCRCCSAGSRPTSPGGVSSPSAWSPPSWFSSCDGSCRNPLCSSSRREPPRRRTGGRSGPSSPAPICSRP